MKLVRYSDPAEGISFDVHPLLTVISGLPPAARDRLVSTIRAIASGGPLEAAGSVEVHGVHLGLTAETLSLLEVSLDADVVLTASDLPGAVAGDASGDLDDAERLELEDAVTAEHAAIARAAAAIAAIALAESELANIRTQRSSVVERLEQTRSELDSFAAAGLKVATDELADLHRRRFDEAVLDLAARRSGLESQLEQLVREADLAKREIRRRGTHDPVKVSDALAHFDSVFDDTPVPVAAAATLADELVAAIAELDDYDSSVSGDRSQLIELTARRDAAYDAFVAAERMLRSPDLDPEQVEQLERTHDEIFELEGRTSKLSVARVRRRVAELRAREARLLGDFGFDTWASYVMGVATPAAGEERLRRYDVAKATYEFAEDELAKAASGPLREAPARSALERHIGELRERAAVVLGHSLGDDPVAELRDHSVPAGSLVGSRDEAVVRLRVELLAVGVDLDELADSDDQPDPLLVRVAAEEWLSARADRDSTVESLESDIASYEERIAALRAELDLVNRPDDVVVNLRDDDPEVEAIQIRIAEAEARVARHHEALETLAGLRADEDRLAQREAEQVDEVARAKRDAEVADSVVRAAAATVASVEERARLAHNEREAQRRLDRRANSEIIGAEADAIEWYVLARLAAQRSVSFVGSVPLVIVDAFSEWTIDELSAVYERLARMSEVIQIIVISDDPDLLRWVRLLGSARGDAVELAAVAAS